MNRKKITSIILMVLLTILPIVSVVMMYHITLCDTLSKMDSGCFGETNVVIKIPDTIHQSEITEKIDELNERVALYQEEKSDGITRKTIYFTGPYVNFPMKSGRFFRAGDLKKGNAIAVIGKNLESQKYIRDGKDYIHVDGGEYEVIGVIGYEEETIIDNYVYINMLAKEEILATTIYTMDIWDESSAIADDYLELLGKMNSEVEKLSETQTYGMTIFPKILYGRWFIWLFLCDLLCIAVVSGQWIRLQKQEMCVRRLVGGTVFRIMWQMTARYLGYVVVSMVLSFIFYIIRFSGYMYTLIVGYAIAIPIMLFILVINMISISKTPLVEVVK